jgi:hypothetical protein
MRWHDFDPWDTCDILPANLSVLGGSFASLVISAAQTLIDPGTACVNMTRVLDLSLDFFAIGRANGVFTADITLDLVRNMQAETAQQLKCRAWERLDLCFVQQGSYNSFYTYIDPQQNDQTSCSQDRHCLCASVMFPWSSPRKTTSRTEHWVLSLLSVVLVHQRDLAMCDPMEHPLSRM